MPIISVRVSEAEHVALVKRAGGGRGALSRLLRRLLVPPQQQYAQTTDRNTETSGGSHIVWEGPGRQEGNTFYLRAS